MGNRGLGLLWKSQFMEKKIAISNFTGEKKRPIRNYANTL